MLIYFKCFSFLRYAIWDNHGYLLDDIWWYLWEISKTESLLCSWRYKKITPCLSFSLLLRSQQYMKSIRQPVSMYSCFMLNLRWNKPLCVDVWHLVPVFTCIQVALSHSLLAELNTATKSALTFVQLTTMSVHGNTSVLFTPTPWFMIPPPWSCSLTLLEKWAGVQHSFIPRVTPLWWRDRIDSKHTEEYWQF